MHICQLPYRYDQPTTWWNCCTRDEILLRSISTQAICWFRITWLPTNQSSTYSWKTSLIVDWWSLTIMNQPTHQATNPPTLPPTKQPAALVAPGSPAQLTQVPPPRQHGDTPRSGRTGGASRPWTWGELAQKTWWFAWNARCLATTGCHRFFEA